MGGVVTTGQDLLAWDRALRGDKILAAAAKAKLHAVALDGYACGWKIETTDRGTVRAHHSGGVMGYRCQVSRWLEDDTFLAVLTNGEGDPFLAERAILPLLFPPPRLEADLEAGAKDLDANGAVVATKDVTVDVSRTGAGATLVVRVGRHALATLRLTKGHLEKLAADLGQALAGREAGVGPRRDRGGPLPGPVRAREGAPPRRGAPLDIRPRYTGRGADGQTVVDDRPLMVLVDGRRGAWPLMVKWNAAAGRRFAEVLRPLLGTDGPARAERGPYGTRPGRARANSVPNGRASPAFARRPSSAFDGRAEGAAQAARERAAATRASPRARGPSGDEARDLERAAQGAAREVVEVLLRRHERPARAGGPRPEAAEVGDAEHEEPAGRERRAEPAQDGHGIDEVLEHVGAREHVHRAGLPHERLRRAPSPRRARARAPARPRRPRARRPRRRSPRRAPPGGTRPWRRPRRAGAPARPRRGCARDGGGTRAGSAPSSAA